MHLGTFRVTHAGSRTDWTLALKRAREGATDVMLMDELPAHSWLQMGRRLGEARSIQSAAQAETTWTGKPEIWVLWGDTRTGKSRLARAMAAEEGWSLYKVPNPDGGRIWFPNYAGEECILLDDFRCGWCSLSYLFDLLDGYPIQVQNKGGFVQKKWTKVIITCNDNPKVAWYYKLKTEKGDHVVDPIWGRINEGAGRIMHFPSGPLPAIWLRKIKS